jgi:hypothetical protein
LNTRPGCYWYLGKTQSGKTKKAYLDLQADIQATGLPSLIIDPMPAWNFRELHHCRTTYEALITLYDRRTHAVFTPRKTSAQSAVDQVDELLQGIRAEGCGDLHVLWDECSFHMSFASITDVMSETVRGWAHHRVTFRLVTQRPGDIHGDVYATDPEVYCFGVDKEGDLKRLKSEFGFEPDTVKALREGEFLTKKRGFAA